MGSVYGVLIGGLIISVFDTVFLAQVLPGLLPTVDVQSLRWVFFGAGLVGIMLFRPQGLFPVGQKGRKEFSDIESSANVPITAQSEVGE
jgi:ABC-type branched-subunit amino acid transport system permease subunit